MNSSDDITGPMNLGNPTELTISEMAEKSLEMTSSKSEIVYKTLPCDNPKKRKPDISFAKSTIGWEPTVTLEKGLEKTIAYFDKLLSDFNRVF